MEAINGEWYMKGCGQDDPTRLRSPQDAIALVRRIGFLPLFSGSVPGFSVEEHTLPRHWWSGDPATDPWEWRMILAENDDIAYGKFFEKKAGFLSKEAFPMFANFRRNGYDFDALYDDGLVSHRAKKIVDALEPDEQMRGRQLLTNELKSLAGFGKDGEKNFSGVLTDLQMQTYLIMGRFRQRVNRRGEPYGWHIAVMETPETKWGYDYISAGYREKPAESFARICERVKAHFPAAEESDIRRALGKK